MKILISIIIILFSHNLLAAEYFFDHERGWHWYEQDKSPIDKNKSITKAKTAEPEPEDVKEAIKKIVDRKLALAYINPDENLKEYIALQEKLSAHNEYFANVWEKTLLQNPELDYSVKHPVNSVGRKAYLDQYRQKQDEIIIGYAKKYGLILFCEGKSAFCEKYSPIIRLFANKYHFATIAVTMDGVPLLRFEHNSKIDNGQAKKLGVKTTPSLYLISPKDNVAIPLGGGILTQDIIKQRIVLAATNYKGML